MITVGGMGTLAAVSLIFIFLVVETAPLFLPAGNQERARSDSSTGLEQPLAMGCDSERNLMWSLHAGGMIALRRLSDGTELLRRDLFDGERPTALSVSPLDDTLIAGFDDGRLINGRIQIGRQLLTSAESAALPDSVLAMEPGALAHGPDLFELEANGDYYRTSLTVDLEPAQMGASPSAITHIDHVLTSAGLVFLARSADGSMALYSVEEREDFMTGGIRKVLASRALELPPGGRGLAPDYMRLSDLAHDLYLAWEDGTVDHYDLRNPGQVTLIETLDLVPETGARLAQLEFHNGSTTLLVGDDAGRLAACFPVQSADGLWRLQRVHDLGQGGGAVSCIVPSTRSRVAAIGHADGTVRLIQVSLAEELASWQVGSRAILAMAMAPKEDGLTVAQATSFSDYDVDLGFPEVSLVGLFSKVHYEGYGTSEHVWQSSSASDDTEPKLGLWPLVFGTLKATLYSMMFGAPLAILAALYTSEFLTTRLKGRVKGTIELMASLPSVVLGFIGGLVIAPFAQSWLPALMAVCLTLPGCLLLGAQLWQVLPRSLALRCAGPQKTIVIAMIVPLGLWAGVQLGPALESLLFAGDMEAWLDGQIGGPLGGWTFLLLPLACTAAVVLSGQFLLPHFRTWSIGRERRHVALADLGRVLLLGLLSVGLALIGAASLSALGYDPRGSLVDTYVSRNALVVGFVMGFAIVPIIYTLAEDALSEVPNHLREGSLGTGATPWQTAVRIVLPTATSGIFSALMIGLGRAVGETMIVLMAAGSTPILEWNIFNGFRTLSANLATELPEAVHGSAHYHTLFLAALVLFGMTFALNTLAELVRRHFRRRTGAL